MFEQLKRLLANELGVFAGDVHPEADLSEDLGLMPVEIVNLLLALEDELEVRLDEETLMTSRTVGDILNYLEELDCEALPV